MVQRIPKATNKIPITHTPICPAVLWALDLIEDVADGSKVIVDALPGPEAVGADVPDGKSVLSEMKAAEFPLLFRQAPGMELETPFMKFTAAHYSSSSAKAIPYPQRSYLIMHTILSILHDLQEPHTPHQSSWYAQSGLTEIPQSIFCDQRYDRPVGRASLIRCDSEEKVGLGV